MLVKAAPGRFAVRALAFLVGAAALWSATAARADTGAADTGVAVSPPRIELAVAPGQRTLEGSITVSNTVARGETRDLPLVDLLVDAHGTYQVADPGATSYSLAGHATLDPVRLDLAPKGTPGSFAQVRLEVNVDRPQPLYGGILVTPRLPDAAPSGGGLAVRVQPRALVPLVAMPVAAAGDLSQLGPQAKLSVSDARLGLSEASRGPLDSVIPFELPMVADHAPLAADVSARNAGNTYARLFTHYRFESVNLLDVLPAKLRAALGVRDTTFLDIDAAPGPSLPGTVAQTRALTKISDGETAPVFGIVRVRATSSMRVLDARSDDTVEDAYLFVIPWKAMLIGLVLLVAAPAVRRMTRRRQAPAPVRQGRVVRPSRRGAFAQLNAMPRHVLGLGALTVLMAVLLAGQAVLADDTSEPAAAALSYLNAESKLDAAATWSAIRVAPIDAPAGTDTSLLTRDALAAMVAEPAAAAHRLTDPRVIGVSMARDEAGADVSFRVDGALRTSTLTLTKGPDGAWRVLVMPSLVAVHGAGGGVEVDGLRPGQPAAAALAVLPGFHRLRTIASAPWEPADAVVDARDPFPTVVDAQLQPQLAPAAAAVAAAAVSAAFAPCLSSSAPAPIGCPNSIGVTGAGPVRWESVGTPAAGATFTPAANGSLVATGHFTFVASYQVHRPDGIRRLVSGGGYRLTLSWDGKTFHADGAPTAAVGLLPLPRPPLADAQVIAATNVASSSPPAVSWDGERGVFEVTGATAAARFVAYVVVDAGGPRTVSVDAA